MMLEYRIFWHSMLERLIKNRLSEALAYTPLVWLTGASRVGKVTLAQRFMTSTFDLGDEDILAAAKRDPKGFVATLPDRSLLAHLDEAPFLLAALEWSIQTLALPARFMVTTSQALDLRPFPTLQRMPRFQLHPLAQAELGARGNVIDLLFSGQSPRVLAADDSYPARLLHGGFPETILAAREDRDLFFERYLESFVAGLRARSQLPRPSLFRKLLVALARDSGEILVQSSLANELDLSAMTLHRYVSLLESYSLVVTIPGFQVPGSRFVKAPRVHLLDTGLACYLLNLNPTSLRDPKRFQPLLRNFAILELRKHLSWSDTVAEVYHLTSYAGSGVDVILEDQRGRVVGIQICGSTKPKASAFTKLKRLRSHIGERFHRGLVLHAGADVLRVDTTLWAMPLGLLYQAQGSQSA
jgi:uncharacterized protein